MASEQPARPFTYGARYPWDVARVKQQNGDYPAPHVFTPFVWDQHMCAWPECYATREGNKPWHLADAWAAD